MAKCKSMYEAHVLSLTERRLRILEDLFSMSQLPFYGKPVFKVSKVWYQELVRQGLLDLLPADIVVAHKFYPQKPLLL